jgi:hypothetical protein
LASYQRVWSILLGFVLILALAAPAAAEPGGPLYTIRQRFGVDVARDFPAPGFPAEITDFPAVESLGLGWYSDWGTAVNPPRPGGIEYAQLMHMAPWPPNWARLEQIIAANPGALWIIGNEPETVGQGGLTPQQYAVMYHDAYAFIKEHDAGAQVAIGGVVMPSPLRLKWLDQCRDYYQRTFSETMPVDVWNFHLQILREKRGDYGCGIPVGLTENEGRVYEPGDNGNSGYFRQLVLEGRAWMAARGERDKPLIISEYGVLYPSQYLPPTYSSAEVIRFMRETFDFMLETRDAELGCPSDENRLVQRWAWFSLNYPSCDRYTPGCFNGALYYWDGARELTPYGEFMRDYIRRVDPRIYLPLIYYPSR